MNNNTAIKKKIAESRRLYQNPYAHLDEIGDTNSAPNLEISASQNTDAIPSIHDLQNPYARLSVENDQSTNEGTVQQLRFQQAPKNKPDPIEQAARELQGKIWKNRHELWPEGVPTDFVEMLDPRKAIEFIGFKLDEQEYLGNFEDEGDATGVAGVIDRIGKRISISTHFPNHIQRFTAAHEIGHALMHKESVIHRDRPVDGARVKRAPMEIEADKFAAFFLMPEKLVRERFKNIFGVEIFVLDDDSAFALEPSNPVGLINKCKDSHDLARVLAGTEYYNGRHVRSLAEQFKVSVGAMAIRIEELQLF
jgi:hypothetical protein